MTIYGGLRRQSASPWSSSAPSHRDGAGGRQTRRTRWPRTARPKQTHPTTSRPMCLGTIAPDHPIMSMAPLPLRRSMEAGHRKEDYVRLMAQRHHRTIRSICTAPHPVPLNGTDSSECSAPAMPQPNRTRATSCRQTHSAQKAEDLPPATRAPLDNCDR